MPIKNLDDSLFQDNKANDPKFKPNLNFGADNTNEIYSQINQFMDEMPDDVMDKFKDLSEQLSSKLDSNTLSNLFNIEINKVEIKNRHVTRLFAALTRYSDDELNSPDIASKLDELTSYLVKRKFNKTNSTNEETSSNTNSETKENTTTNKTEEDLEKNALELASHYIKIISEFKDDVLSMTVDEFDPDEFIRELGFNADSNGFVKTDFRSLTLINPITNLPIDLTGAKMVYGSANVRTNSKLADRVLLYLKDGSYVILYAYKLDGSYHFYIPKRANIGLLDIKNRLALKKVRQAFFKDKSIKSCLEQIEAIFVLKKEVNFKPLELGSITPSKPYYMGDELVNVGTFTFNDLEIARLFKQKFDISDDTIPFFFKVNIENSYMTSPQFSSSLATYNFTNPILNNYDLKYNHLRNYLYLEIN